MTSPKFILGDLKHWSLGKEITKKQYITHASPIYRVLGKCYSCVPEACRSLPLPPHGNADQFDICVPVQQGMEKVVTSIKQLCLQGTKEMLQP